jgi:hypothetical protein
MIDAGKMIKKFEFHERKSSNLIKPFIELYCYIDESIGTVEQFLAFCVGPEKWVGNYGMKADFEYKSKQCLKTRALRPHFDLSINYRRIDVYPKENLVVSSEVGLHYICQHLFDFLPSEIKERFYPVIKEEDFVIGQLFIDHGRAIDRQKAYDVKALDITKGFMLTHEQIQEFSDKFSEWVAYRRLGEQINAK